MYKNPYLLILLVIQPKPFQAVLNDQSLQQQTIYFRGGNEYLVSKRRIGIQILQKRFFPNWPERVEYQKKQRKVH